MSFSEPLTRRETEVLVAFAIIEPHDTKTVAKSLELAPNTVKSHIEHIYRKLNVDSKIAAFRRMGWLAPR